MPENDNDEFAEIARRMRDLGLTRDIPFAEKPAPDYATELENRIKTDMEKGKDAVKNRPAGEGEQPDIDPANDTIWDYPW
jgi:hypothetical protein